MNPALPFAVQGSSTFSTPSSLRRKPVHGQRRLRALGGAAAFRAAFFTAVGDTSRRFPQGTCRGSRLTTDDRYVTTSVAHSWVLELSALQRSAIWLRPAARPTVRRTAPTVSPTSGSRRRRRTTTCRPSASPGRTRSASSPIGTRSQRTFLFEDSLSWVLGNHNVQIGGGFTRALRDFEHFRQPGALTFQSFPDFLLGLNAAQNGTNLFSNVFVSVDLTGQFDRASRNWETSAYIQDNLPGVVATHGQRRRSMGISAASDRRDGSSDDGRCQLCSIPNPPASGSLAGIVVPAQLSRHDSRRRVPDRSRHHHGPGEDAHARVRARASTWRVLGDSSRMVIRGGYGLYFSRTTGQVQTQTTTTQPFGLLRASAGPPNAPATFANPFPNPIPTEASFPLFVPYTPASNLTAIAVARNLEPGRVSSSASACRPSSRAISLWEIGYVGTRGDHLAALAIGESGVAGQRVQPDPRRDHEHRHQHHATQAVPRLVDERFARGRSGRRNGVRRPRDERDQALQQRSAVPGLVHRSRRPSTPTAPTPKPTARPAPASATRMTMRHGAGRRASAGRIVSSPASSTSCRG